jgi:hypothetical protein
LTTWSAVLLEKLMAAQPVNTFPAFCDRVFFAVFTRGHAVVYAKVDESSPDLPTLSLLTPILILRSIYAQVFQVITSLHFSGQYYILISYFHSWYMPLSLILDLTAPLFGEAPHNAVFCILFTSTFFIPNIVLSMLLGIKKGERNRGYRQRENAAL